MRPAETDIERVDVFDALYSLLLSVLIFAGAAEDRPGWNTVQGAVLRKHFRRLSVRTFVLGILGNGDGVSGLVGTFFRQCAGWNTAFLLLYKFFNILRNRNFRWVAVRRIALQGLSDLE